MDRKESRLIVVSDLLLVIKKNRKKVYGWMFLFAFIIFVYKATSPVEYIAEGTFKEKGKTVDTMGSVTSLLFGKSPDASNGLSLIKSRRLAEKLVLSNDLQAMIKKSPSDYFSDLSRIKNNLIAEYAHFRNIQVPLLKDETSSLKIKNVEYTDEIPLNLLLIIDSEESFSLYGSNKLKLGNGTFDVPYMGDHFTFTIEKLTSDLLKKQEYTITLLPLATIAKEIIAKFTIKSNVKEPALIEISYRHPNRFHAVKHIKHFMQLYIELINEETQIWKTQQMAYLESRQKELTTELEKDLNEYAETLSLDLSTTGFPSSSEAFYFLAKNQEKLSEQLLELDMDIHRLGSIYQNGSANYEKIAFIPVCEKIEHLINEMNALKQQEDTLNFSLRSEELNSQEFQDSFDLKVEELDLVVEDIQEAKQMHLDLKNNQMPSPDVKLMNRPQFIVKIWYEHLLAYQDKKNSAEWLKIRDGFIAYLYHLEHYLEVYQRNLKEQLAHQLVPIKEFQGIALDTARELYVNYSRELNQLESELIQLQFMSKQLEDPSFEISSLSSILHDGISSDMMAQTSHLVLSLKDNDNRSSREQERIKGDLAIQKDFLMNHLLQNSKLLDLRQTHVKSKIRALQNINLSLVNERISILENQIKQFIANAIESMNDERKLLVKHISELKVDLSLFPKKWTAEQLIEYKMEVNRRTMEELIQLVETKSINDNLEIIKSSPVDLPIVPLHPKSQSLMLFTFFGAFLGGFLSISWLVMQAVTKGVGATAESLHLAGQHVCGIITRKCGSQETLECPLNNDLETLRSLMTFMSDHQKTEDSKSLLLLINQGPSYAYMLAELLSKKGEKTLVIDMCLDQCQEENTTGLLQYLEGTEKKIHIQHKSRYDLIVSGGACRYANELLGSRLFDDLLNTLKRDYEWIIAYSNIKVQGAEADNLIQKFPLVAISVIDETLQQLDGYFISGKGKKCSFLIVDNLEA